MDSVTELNELIYVRAKVIFDKIGMPLRNLSKNTKPVWEIKLDIKQRW